MVRECAHQLPEGHKCPNPARRNQKFCRHHGKYSAAAHPPERNFSRLQYWREFSGCVHFMDHEEAKAAIPDILTALREGLISHRCAGRILQELLRKADTAATPDRPSTPATMDATTYAELEAMLNTLTAALNGR